jgi:hypothetical protein
MAVSAGSGEARRAAVDHHGSVIGPPRPPSPSSGLPNPESPYRGTLGLADVGVDPEGVPGVPAAVEVGAGLVRPLRRARIDERQDVGVLQRRGGLDLRYKARRVDDRGELGFQDLERDPPVVLEVLGLYRPRPFLRRRVSAGGGTGRRGVPGGARRRRGGRRAGSRPLTAVWEPLQSARGGGGKYGYRSMMLGVDPTDGGMAPLSGRIRYFRCVSHFERFPAVRPRVSVLLRSHAVVPSAGRVR